MKQYLTNAAKNYVSRSPQVKDLPEYKKDRLIRGISSLLRMAYKYGFLDGLTKTTKEEQTKKLTKGICRVCGCTEDNPCPGGCSWTDTSKTLCTRCE